MSSPSSKWSKDFPQFCSQQAEFMRDLVCYTQAYIGPDELDTAVLDASMLEVTCNDRLGKKVRVKCNPDDTIGDLKKLIAAQTGTRYDKIVLKKWYTIFKDHIKLEDYEIHDGMNLELYYQ